VGLCQLGHLQGLHAQNIVAGQLDLDAGVPRELRQQLEHGIKVRMRGHTESYRLATVGGVAITGGPTGQREGSTKHGRCRGADHSTAAGLGS
jgi:hypothetical protein